MFITLGNILWKLGLFFMGLAVKSWRMDKRYEEIK
jgi:hypothetical protein